MLVDDLRVLGVGLAQWIGARACLLCRRPGFSPWCEACGLGVEPMDERMCARCGLPAGSACPRCRPDLEPLDSVRAVLLYRGDVRRLVLRMKLDPEPAACRPLGELLAQTAATLRGRVDVVVPVPADARTLRARGFNPPALLARPVARAVVAPLAARALGRRGHQPKASALRRRRDRLARLPHVYVVRQARAVAERSVLLVDDVLTTGATALSCAHALKDAGAREVHLLALARTPLGIEVARDRAG